MVKSVAKFKALVREGCGFNRTGTVEGEERLEPCDYGSDGDICDSEGVKYAFYVLHRTWCTTYGR